MLSFVFAIARSYSLAVGVQEVEAATKFRKFLGEKILVDRTEPATAEKLFSTHTVIGLNVSNVASHPGKTLYGCSYRIEVIDKGGKPF